MSATNEQIDAAVLNRIREGVCGVPTLAHIIGEMDFPAPRKTQPLHWWLAELQNRSCQRLRKKGLIRYDRKKGWVIAVNR